MGSSGKELWGRRGDVGLYLYIYINVEDIHPYLGIIQSMFWAIKLFTHYTYIQPTFLQPPSSA